MIITHRMASCLSPTNPQSCTNGAIAAFGDSEQIFDNFLRPPSHKAVGVGWLEHATRHFVHICSENAESGRVSDLGLSIRGRAIKLDKLVIPVLMAPLPVNIGRIEGLAAASAPSRPPLRRARSRRRLPCAPPPPAPQSAARAVAWVGKPADGGVFLMGFGI